MLPMNPARKKSRVRIGPLLVVLFWAAVLAAGLYNLQSISDWLKLRGYHAPAAVAAIASQDTMTPYARKVFYVNKPDIAPKASFATLCPSGTEQTVVLGCYHPDQNGIDVLRVSDPRLSGIEQVTSAHEMLHAAYDRLSSAQRKQVDSRLMDYYQHDLHDPTIRAQIAAYKKTEPHAVVNEMHSVFGTEVAQLPTQLEHYYQRYFTNRAAVVAFYNQYQSEFTSRVTTIKADNAQLQMWKPQIAADETNLQAEYASLEAQKGQLDAARSNSRTDDYNNQVTAYNSAVDAYNAQVASLRSLVSQYNALVNSVNNLVLETQQLTNEINSQVSPIGN
ncbi:MAG TPA: hypothetical protein VF261_00925 [Candidatus Saccharimonadales bacterium]